MSLAEEVEEAATSVTLSLFCRVQAGQCDRHWLEPQTRVLGVLLRMDAKFANILPQLLVLGVVLPLLSTVEVRTINTRSE